MGFLSSPVFDQDQYQFDSTFVNHVHVRRCRTIALDVGKYVGWRFSTVKQRHGEVGAGRKPSMLLLHNSTGRLVGATKRLDGCVCLPGSACLCTLL